MHISLQQSLLLYNGDGRYQFFNLHEGGINRITAKSLAQYEHQRMLTKIIFGSVTTYLVDGKVMAVKKGSHYTASKVDGVRCTSAAFGLSNLTRVVLDFFVIRHIQTTATREEVQKTATEMMLEEIIKFTTSKITGEVS